MYSSHKNGKIVISRLRHSIAIISGWFYKNFMVLNADKSYFLTAGYNELYPENVVSDAAIEKLVKGKNLCPYLDQAFLIFQLPRRDWVWKTSTQYFLNR